MYAKTILSCALVAAAGIFGTRAAHAQDYGCWIEVYDLANFNNGDGALRIYGPIKIRDLRGIFKDKGPGNHWDDVITSLRVGPNADVTFWVDDDFDDTQSHFGANSSSTRVGEDNQFESLEIKHVP